MHLKETHSVPEEISPLRLQEYGVGIFQRISTKSALKKAIKKELVLVDGIVATTATMIVGGESIVYLHPSENRKKTRLILNLDVIYEDEYLAVINKPAGILVSGNGFKTVANALPQNLKKSFAVDAVSPQPVHRLDYATTGMLLVGKTSSSIMKLNQLFEHKEIEKIYYAVTIGGMDADGSINSDIDGKPSKSSFKVLKSIVSERFICLNLVKLSPHTGRRHQLRKHMLSIGNPILGDATYFLEGLQLKGKGLYLHAKSLRFQHPITNEEIRISSNLPKSFKKLFTDIV
ncbi:23S rRNA pseudouridine1911/1915/1917 synthase [Maribacter spongiicola]|uniref:23S rRNA pseudouridine1911/1915/1917 synthase n=1 Tax=Maribacter spongiicola TaxID=1206753 RepID=A0A4R7K5D9_9FLAO|nr:RluA family pseudouridine synthase [Maribacter spongiicola]TDT44889.1 23S rRNA pseudouridine1911/1915/1917 synthase [Maribacter spongiicola]